MGGLARIPKQRGGAPSLLTPERQEKITEYLAQGVPAHVAARAAGISKQTFYNWKKKGNEEIEAGEEGSYRDFVESVEWAEAKAEAEMIKMVVAAAPTDWRAAMTYLERRRPDEWGKKERIEHSGSDQPIKIKLTWDD